MSVDGQEFSPCSIAPVNERARLEELFNPGQQLSQRNLKSARDADDIDQAYVPLSALDPANVCPMQIGSFGKSLLGKPQREPFLSKILAKPEARIRTHAPDLCGIKTMILETISIIISTVNKQFSPATGRFKMPTLKTNTATPSAMSMRELTTQQIGRLGELLVQYKLLRLGIDSAPLTIDNGIDLVAYFPDRKSSFTIQVKTNFAPKPGGGKGAPAINWRLSESCPAEWIALADISTGRVWLLTRQELDIHAQQRSNGRLHLYMYTDPDSGPKAYERHGDSKFSEYLFENRTSLLFNGDLQ